MRLHYGAKLELGKKRWGSQDRGMDYCNYFISYYIFTLKHKSPIKYHAKSTTKFNGFESFAMYCKNIYLVLSLPKMWRIKINQPSSVKFTNLALRIKFTQLLIQLQANKIFF